MTHRQHPKWFASLNKKPLGLKFAFHGPAAAPAEPDEFTVTALADTAICVAMGCSGADASCTLRMSHRDSTRRG
jgi:hypothetical protein